MIAELQGVVRGCYSDNTLILDVHGVGYRVEVSTRFAQSLPRTGETLRVLIEPYIREDQFRLFGFPNEAERDWFGLLMRVPAVGAKLALAILGQFEPAILGALIAQNDAAALAQAPGVGKKLAARIIQELRDKIPAQAVPVSASASANGDGTNHMARDAISALRHLGYAPQEAQRVVQSIHTQEPDVQSTAQLIRRALQELGR